MRILILEDSKDRIEFFKKLYKNCEVFIFNNASAAINFIQIEKIDVFLVDHDLTANPDELTENNGYEFAKRLTKTKLHQDSIFYITSMNPVGANNIVNLLKDNNYSAEWYPFNLFLVRNK